MTSLFQSLGMFNSPLLPEPALGISWQSSCSEPPPPHTHQQGVPQENTKCNSVNYIKHKWNIHAHCNHLKPIISETSGRLKFIAGIKQDSWSSPTAPRREIVFSAIGPSQKMNRGLKVMCFRNRKQNPARTWEMYLVIQLHCSQKPQQKWYQWMGGCQEAIMKYHLERVTQWDTISHGQVSPEPRS